MSSVVALNPMSEAHNQNHNLIVIDEWREAAPEQRETALCKEMFLMPFYQLTSTGVSVRKAIKNVMAHIDAGHYNDKFMSNAQKLGRGNKLPGRSTITEWLKAYTEQGKVGLLDKYTGRVRQAQGWEAAAYRLYNIPSKPSYAAVARKLREDHGFASATDDAVRRYIKSLPADMGDLSPQRMGRKLYNNTQRHFIQRTTESLPVGFLYQGDGHTIDVYLAHPVTGDIWRAELTVWMDIRSRYITAWYISNAESSIDTIRCMAMALTNHNHVPAMLYVDNGCGYASRMMDDDVTGFYQRLEMETIFAIPGNAKAKGNVERFFRTMERDFNIWFGDAFCGEGMAKDRSTQFVNDCKRGKRQPPSLTEWCRKFEAWLEKYHNRPHPEAKSTTPAALWATLESTPVNMDIMDLVRPQKTRKVLRGAVSLDNRQYRHPELVRFNRQDVVVQYDLTTDETVTIRSLKGELICDATLVKKADYIPTSRIEEAKQKSTKAAITRLEKKADEKRRRSGLLLDHADTLGGLEELDATNFSTLTPQTHHAISAEDADVIDIDLTQSAQPPQDELIDIKLEDY